jgi:hypothetical protein
MKPIYNFRYIHHNLDATIRNHTGYRHSDSRRLGRTTSGRLNNFTSAKRESTANLTSVDMSRVKVFRIWPRCVRAATGRSDAHALRARAAGQRGPAGGEVRLAAARDSFGSTHGAACVRGTRDRY